MNGNRWSAARSALVIVALGTAACASDSKGPTPAGPPATLTVVSGSGQEGESGEPLATALTVKAVDLQGRPVPRAVVTFAVASGGGTLAQALDTTDTEGLASTRWTMGEELGAASVTARVTGLVTPAVFSATVKAGPPAVVARISGLVGSSASGFDVADSVAIKLSDRFGHPIAGTNVTFAVTGGGGTVSHATKASGADGVARTAWKLGAAGAQTLRASAGALNLDVTGTAVTCTETSIAVGQVVEVTSGAATCLVTTATGAQKYIVAVSNSSISSSSAGSFHLRGAGGGAATTAEPAARPVSVRAGGLSQMETQRALDSRMAARDHSNRLRANFELIERLGPARRAQNRLARNLVQAPPPPNVGDILPVKIPTNFSALCSISSAATIGARVVYAGTRGVVLVDTAAASNIAIDDAKYRAVGAEFDNSMFPILLTNFGNPLAMDDQTDQNGRLFMVFSKRVNDMEGIAGFVTSADFFATADCPASNLGEYFYARVPTETGEGYTTGNTTQTFDEWQRATRTVIIHEVKHITSFAEKFASPIVIPSGYFQRDQWLEEGSAMMAEELWARTIFGYAQNGNTNYANSIFCEVRPRPDAAWPQCQPAKPVAMLDHFFFLYQYFNNSEVTSAVGSTPTGESTFYGSGWAFIRWVIDTYAPSESAFLTAMNMEMVSPGTDNMEKRTGKSFADLMSEFAMAIALDDLPGFTPADPKYSLRSWNTRDMFASLSADFSNQNPPYFASPSPLKIRANGFGKFAVDVPAVHGGGFSLFEVAGSTTSKQLLEFKGASGSGFPAEMRVRIARVQ